MTAGELFAALERRGLRVVRDGGRLTLCGRPELITDALLEEVKRHKAALLTAYICSLCNSLIAERLSTTWAGQSCHLGCGEAAFQAATVAGEYER